MNAVDRLRRDLTETTRWWRHRLAFRQFPQPLSISLVDLGRWMLVAVPLFVIMASWNALFSYWVPGLWIFANILLLLPALFLLSLLPFLWERIPFWLSTTVIWSLGIVTWLVVWPAQQAQFELFSTGLYSRHQVWMMLASPAFTENVFLRSFVAHIPLGWVEQVESWPDGAYFVGIPIAAIGWLGLLQWLAWRAVTIVEEPAGRVVLSFYLAMGWPMLVIHPIGAGVALLALMEISSPPIWALVGLVGALALWPRTWMWARQLRQLLANKCPKLGEGWKEKLSTFSLSVPIWSPGKRLTRRLGLAGRMLREFGGWLLGWFDRPMLRSLATRSTSLTEAQQEKLEEWGRSRWNSHRLWKLIAQQRRHARQPVEEYLKRQASAELLATVCWHAPPAEFGPWFQRLTDRSPRTAFQLARDLLLNDDGRLGAAQRAYLMSQAPTNLRQQIMRELGTQSPSKQQQP